VLISVVGNVPLGGLSLMLSRILRGSRAFLAIYTRTAVLRDAAAWNKRNLGRNFWIIYVTAPRNVSVNYSQGRRD